MIKEAFVLLFLIWQVSSDTLHSFPGVVSCGKSPSQGTICYMKPMDFYPTQFMIGYDLAYQKQLEIESFDEHQLEKYLHKNMIPVVIAPGNKFYMTDHHHHCRAMYDAKIKSELKVLIANITYNWADIDEKDFWPQMLKYGFYWPYESLGKGPLDPMYLPHHIDNIPDDPYRSLVGNLIDVGAITDSIIPFAGYMWSNYFRERIDILNWTAIECHPTIITPKILQDMSWCCVRPADPSCFPDKYHNATMKFLPEAILLAHSYQAKGLPGWKPCCAKLKN